MPMFEVETDLIVHTKVKVLIEANDKAAAVDRVAAIMPNNSDRDSVKGWKAKVELTAPKGVQITVGRAYHFEQASGGDKVRKV